MPKVNPYNVFSPRAELPQETREFSDRSQPGVVVPVTLTALSGPLEGIARDNYRNLLRRHVTGHGGQKAVPLMSGFGGAIPMSESACEWIGELMARQALIPEADRYTATEWACYLDETKEMFDDFLAFGRVLDERLEKNASALAGENSSPGSSNGTASIPSSPSDETRSSSPSTNGSDPSVPDSAATQPEMISTP